MVYYIDMSSKWSIIYYVNKDGKCLIEDFINSRKFRNKAKILSFLLFHLELLFLILLLNSVDVSEVL